MTGLRCKQRWCSRFAAQRAPAAQSTGAADSAYHGRSVPYTSVHTSQLETFYELEMQMRNKRLPQPKPKA
jgi:hypothetical protein